MSRHEAQKCISTKVFPSFSGAAVVLVGTVEVCC